MAALRKRVVSQILPIATTEIHAELVAVAQNGIRRSLKLNLIFAQKILRRSLPNSTGLPQFLRLSLFPSDFVVKKQLASRN